LECTIQNIVFELYISNVFHNLNEKKEYKIEIFKCIRLRIKSHGGLARSNLETISALDDFTLLCSII